MDGLLLDTERMGLAALLHVGGLHGLVDIEPAFLQCVGHRQPDSDAIIHREFGAFTDVEKLLADWAAYLAPMYEQAIPIKQCAFEMLSTLKAQGIPIAVATSTKTSKAEAHLQQAGLAQFVDLVVGGDQVTNGKPDPETYLTAAARLNVDIDHCVAFEDSDTGTTAAFRSGARTVQVPDLKQPSDVTRAFGHIIAPNLLAGAKLAGLPV